MPTSKLGHFSHENFGDCEIRGLDGQTRTEKRASELLPSVEGLSAKQWEAIKAAAKQFAFSNQSEPSTPALTAQPSEADIFLLQQSDTEEEKNMSNEESIEI